MSEQKWTYTANGPRSRLASIKDENGLYVAFEVPLHIAPRIVACVNACAGIFTEALEANSITNLVEAACEARDFLDKVHKREPLPYSADGAVNALVVALYPFRVDADPAVLAVFKAKTSDRRPVIEPTPSPPSEKEMGS